MGALPVGDFAVHKCCSALTRIILEKFPKGPLLLHHGQGSEILLWGADDRALHKSTLGSWLWEFRDVCAFNLRSKKTA